MREFLKSSLVSICGIALAGAVSYAPTWAQQLKPLPQRDLSRGLVFPVRPTPLIRGPHYVFGTIVKLSPKGNAFLLLTRRGAILNVDASVAISTGQYSAPLFVGKVVLMNGGLDARRVFHARGIERIEHLDRTTPSDT